MYLINKSKKINLLPITREFDFILEKKLQIVSELQKANVRKKNKILSKLNRINSMLRKYMQYQLTFSSSLVL